MTEDEAKTKWCFHFIASHNDPRQPQSEHGLSRGLPGPFAHHCIASACMAWRWDAPERTMPGYRRPVTDGHCGLAGPVP